MINNTSLVKKYFTKADNRLKKHSPIIKLLKKLA